MTERLTRRLAGYAFRPLLSLEKLEGRWCPSVTSSFQDGALVLTGNQANDTVQVTAQADGDIVINANKGQLVRTIDGEDLQSIQVNLGGGSDRLTIDLSKVEEFTQALKVQVTGGAGSDKISVNLGDKGSSEAVSLSFDLGAGNDTLDLTGGGDFGEEVALTVTAGGGRDAVNVDLGDASLNGDAKLKLDLGAGNDSLTFDVGGDVNGSVDLSVNAGGGNDKVSVAFGGEVAGDFAATIDLGGGNDKFTASVTGDVSGATDMTINGGGGNDVATVNLGGDVSGDLSVTADLGNGNDDFNLDVSGALGGTATVDVTGGAGNDDVVIDIGGDIDGAATLTADLGAGNDTLDLRLTGSVNADEDIVVEADGGAGRDKATFTLGSSGGGSGEGSTGEEVFDRLDLNLTNFEQVSGLPTSGEGEG